MTAPAAIIALVSALIFTGLILIPDRPKGALIAQTGSVLAGIVILGVLVIGPTVETTGLSPFLVSAMAVAVLAATVAGMFYHLFLGRFEDIWRARTVFALVYLGMAAVLGTVYLALF